MAMDTASKKPYEENNPYKRRFQKKAATPNDDTATESDSAETETTSKSSTSSDSRPVSVSSFSKDAIKRRLAKDNY